jgi:hypothetical protein
MPRKFRKTDRGRVATNPDEDTDTELPHTGLVEAAAGDAVVADDAASASDGISDDDGGAPIDWSLWGGGDGTIETVRVRPVRYVVEFQRPPGEPPLKVQATCEGDVADILNTHNTSDRGPHTPTSVSALKGRAASKRTKITGMLTELEGLGSNAPPGYVHRLTDDIRKATTSVKLDRLRGVNMIYTMTKRGAEPWWFAPSSL